MFGKKCSASMYLLMTIALCLMVTGAFAETAVIARVGSVPITDFELNQKLREYIPLASSFHKGISEEKVNELREKALNFMIDRALMTQYALTDELVVSSKSVDEDLLRIKSQFKTDDEFKKALGSLSLEDLRAAIYRKLLAEKALDVAVAQKVNVTEASTKAYYEENKNRFKRPRQFRASHILIKVDPAATAEDKLKRLEFANDLTKRARDGEDFYDLAYYNSDDRTKFVGGDMGLFHQGQILAEVENAILEMQVGEISDPVQTLYGYSIVKLVEDNPPQQLTFEEMKVKLMEEEKTKQYDALKADWLNSLKRKYKVEYLSK